MDIDQDHDNFENFDNFIALGITIEEAKKRCEAVMDTVETLNLSSSCKQTLLRLIQSELTFLSRFSSTNFTPNHEPSICVNIGHFESMVHILKHPNISSVSRVCKKIPSQLSKDAHVDIICTFNGKPVWFIVSDRNPKYISWHAQPDSSKNKGLKARIQLLLDVAHNSLALKPTTIIFFFSNGLNWVMLEKFHTEFGAINVGSKFSNFGHNLFLGRSYEQASVLEIKIDSPGNVNAGVLEKSFVGDPVKPGDVDFGGSFGNLVMKMILPNNSGFINFDTTALIAIISGISNGNTQKILATPGEELKTRFKGNYEFVIGQVMSEIENPIHIDIGNIILGKKCIICERVFLEFKELVLMCGGVNERLRANYLLKCVVVVPDRPSTRVMGLPTTRKLALKNKIVFGTGDYWGSPTLSANMGFVRAVLQTGMSLFTIEHRPRALTGD